jgi:hypothetical protein
MNRWAALFPLLLLSVRAVAAQASDARVAELVERAKELDGREVRVVAEAIGMSMRRLDGTWINVSDGSGAIGLWFPGSGAMGVEVFGSWSFRGDILRAVGVFHRACGEHGGDMDIHVIGLEIVERGKAVAHPLDLRRALAASCALVFGSCALIAYFLAARRKS